MREALGEPERFGGSQNVIHSDHKSQDLGSKNSSDDEMSATEI